MKHVRKIKASLRKNVRVLFAAATGRGEHLKFSCWPSEDLFPKTRKWWMVETLGVGSRARKLDDSLAFPSAFLSCLRVYKEQIWSRDTKIRFTIRASATGGNGKLIGDLSGTTFSNGWIPTWWIHPNSSSHVHRSEHVIQCDTVTRWFVLSSDVKLQYSEPQQVAHLCTTSGRNQQRLAAITSHQDLILSRCSHLAQLHPEAVDVKHFRNIKNWGETPRTLKSGRFKRTTYELASPRTTERNNKQPDTLDT